MNCTASSGPAVTVHAAPSTVCRCPASGRDGHVGVLKLGWTVPHYSVPPSPGLFNPIRTARRARVQAARQIPRARVRYVLLVSVRPEQHRDACIAQFSDGARKGRVCRLHGCFKIVMRA